MADTARGDWPEVDCGDCGVKGVSFKHWGPLVRPGNVGLLCGECMIIRSQSGKFGQNAEPLGYRKKAIEFKT